MSFSAALKPQSLTEATRSHVVAQERKEALKLAEHRTSGKRCLTCKFFKTRQYFISVCIHPTKKNKAVKPYNICHLYEEEQNAPLPTQLNK